MCLECGKKACEIDAKHPHFIDEWNGFLNYSKRLPHDEYIMAVGELLEFMKAKHGRIVKL